MSWNGLTTTRQWAIRLLVLAAYLTVAATVLLLPLPAAHAEGECASAPNPIVCENALPGDPAQRLADQRYWSRLHPGLCDVDERQRRPNGVLQDRHAGELLPHRHPAARLLRRRWRAYDRYGHQTDGDAAADSASMSARSIDRADRLRQLGRVGVMDGAQQCGLRAYTSRIWCATTTPAATARSRSSCATTPATRTSCCRPPTRPGRPTTTTAATACTRAPSRARRVTRGLQGRLHGLLQPPVRRRFTTDGGARICTTPSTR